MSGGEEEFRIFGSDGWKEVEAMVRPQLATTWRQSRKGWSPEFTDGQDRLTGETPTSNCGEPRR